MVCYGLLGILLNTTGQVLTMKQPLFQALFIFVVYVGTEIVASWLGLLKTHHLQPEIYSISVLAGLYLGDCLPAGVVAAVGLVRLVDAWKITVSPGLSLIVYDS